MIAVLNAFYIPINPYQLFTIVLNYGSIEEKQ